MSTKTVAQKLLIKANTAIWISDSAHLGLIAPLPANVTVVNAPSEASAVFVFATDAESLRATLDAHRGHLAQPDLLWVAYPKGNRADINRDTVWPILAEYGLRPITQVAIDDVWSALRFRPLKEGEAPFTGGRRPA